MSLDEGWIRSSISCLTLATGGNESEEDWAKAIVQTENPPASVIAEMRPIQTRFILILNAIIVIWCFDVKHRKPLNSRRCGPGNFDTFQNKSVPEGESIQAISIEDGNAVLC